MPLRKSPTRTPALLAALRASSLKSTGPRTARGKARACLNALKHGRYARHLPQKLVQTGDQDGAALYQWFHGEIVGAFGVTEPWERPEAEHLAARVWCLGRRLEGFERKLERLLESGPTWPLPPSRLQNSDGEPLVEGGARFLAAAEALLDVGAGSEDASGEGAVRAPSTGYPAGGTVAAVALPELEAELLGAAGAGGAAQATLEGGMTERSPMTGLMRLPAFLVESLTIEQLARESKGANPIEHLSLNHTLATSKGALSRRTRSYPHEKNHLCKHLSLSPEQKL